MMTIGGIDLEVFINQGGGVTVRNPNAKAPDENLIASHRAEALLLFGILETLQAIKGQVEP